MYARKRINRVKLFGHDKQAQKTYENEIKVLSKVAENDHLIKVAGTYTDRKYLVMLLEPVANENLKEYMNRGPLTSSAEQQRFRTYFGCLAHTIRFLHDSPIETIHKDIKPENILLKDGHLILTDFGTAFDWSKTGQSMTRSNAGDLRTPRYQSPEVATANEFHRSSDIWSLGVVFLEMVTVLRGKRIAELDSFLQSNGHRQVAIHLNLDAAMNWFEQLQKHESGSPIDNEPLSWIKRMLNRVQSNRPTAAVIYQDIVAFHDGTFCGPCCSDAESSTSADEDFQIDIDMLSDIMEDDELHTMEPLMQQPEASRSRDSSQPVVKSSQKDNEIAGSQFAQENISVYSTIEEEVTSSVVSPEIDVAAPLPSEKRVRFQKKSRPQSTRSTSRRKAPRDQDDTGTSIPASSVFNNKKSVVKPKSTPLFEKEKFVKWLASLPDIFKAPLPEYRSAEPVKPFARSKTRHPTVESQRIGHFLSSLPEETSGYESAPGAHSEPTIEYLDRSQRSLTFPTSDQQYVQRSKSLEELPTASYLLAEETDDDQFSDVTKSKLVHYASDGALDVALTMSKQTLGETIEELKAFTAMNIFLNLNGSSTNTQQKTKKKSTRRSKVPRGSISDVQGVTSLPPEALNQNSKAQAPDVASVRSHSTKVIEPPRLGSYLKGVPQRRRRRWESATVIMKKILDDKISEAPTSVMSVSTRAKVSQSKPVLRWNDRYYGWLPSFVATGKVGAVKEMLGSGCNPGTTEKPRWAPIYNAIRGATDRHTKCLRALVSYGADVNAVKRANGRRPIHYAIERAPWSGYSSVIYTLLAAKANPNAKDKANDVPLLMLLTGDGPLPQEKRDALYLLLAPNFTTNLNVYIPGTLDNPLHLAIRRKDAYTVDAILEKMKQVQGDTLSLIHDYNGTGFTPLLLAFTIFTLTARELDEELQIIRLLLKHGANPNDQDIAHQETPLHIVVRTNKNTIALELLCKHAANATILNNANQSAIDLARKIRIEHPKDKWYLFAKRRMRNQLSDKDYRPPELLAFLNEEVGLDTEGNE